MALYSTKPARNTTKLAAGFSVCVQDAKKPPYGSTLVRETFPATEGELAHGCGKQMIRNFMPAANGNGQIQIFPANTC
jgi:hypothetical protein